MIPTLDIFESFISLTKVITSIPTTPLSPPPQSPPPHQFWNQIRYNQFQISQILHLTGAQNSHEPEISQFLPFMLQLLDNVRRYLIFLTTCRGNRSLHVALSK